MQWREGARGRGRGGGRRQPLRERSRNRDSRLLLALLSPPPFHHSILSFSSSSPLLSQLPSVPRLTLPHSYHHYNPSTCFQKTTGARQQSAFVTKIAEVATEQKRSEAADFSPTPNASNMLRTKR